MTGAQQKNDSRAREMQREQERREERAQEAATGIPLPPIKVDMGGTVRCRVSIDLDKLLSSFPDYERYNEVRVIERITQSQPEHDWTPREKYSRAPREVVVGFEDALDLRLACELGKLAEIEDPEIDSYGDYSIMFHVAAHCAAQETATVRDLLASNIKYLWALALESHTKFKADEEREQAEIDAENAYRMSPGAVYIDMARKYESGSLQWCVKQNDAEGRPEPVFFGPGEDACKEEIKKILKAKNK